LTALIEYEGKQEEGWPWALIGGHRRSWQATQCLSTSWRRTMQISTICSGSLTKFNHLFLWSTTYL